jgi:hypothetical protein
VFVGDDVVDACVPIAVAANDVIDLCELDLRAFVAVLSRITTVDNTSRERTICRTADGPVTVRQNEEPCPE